jgi:hypothetical protein
MVDQPAPTTRSAIVAQIQGIAVNPADMRMLMCIDCTRKFGSQVRNR